mgnify:CR=1 FL=1
MCSQKAATKRERDINSGALTIHPREQRLIPKASEIVEAVEIGTGITNPWRLTLSDGQFTQPEGALQMTRTGL